MSQIENEKVALKKILDGLWALGWHCNAVNDGEEVTKVYSVEETVAAASTTDESWVRLLKNGNRATLYLVWGNSPEELCADMSEAHGFYEDFKKVDAMVFPEEEATSEAKEISFTVTAHYDGILPSPERMAALMAEALEQMRQESTLTDHAPDVSCNWVKVQPK